jgi:hypothetical protein
MKICQSLEELIVYIRTKLSKQQMVEEIRQLRRVDFPFQDRIQETLKVKAIVEQLWDLF